jgi:hypothetical protein
MTGSVAPTPARKLRPLSGARLLPIASILLLIAVALALAAYKYPPPSIGITFAGGLALSSLLALALTRYDVAVALGLILIGIQAVEPAPADVIFAVVISVAAVAGRFDINRVPLTILGSLSVLVALNIMSTIEAIDPKTAAFFFSITLYLAIFGIWLADYVDSRRRARLVVYAYLAAAAVSALIGVAGLMIAPESTQIVYLETRARAFFADPNVFGPFMIPILLIVLDETLTPRLLRLPRLIKVGLLLLLASAVLLSFSRAAWLNCVVGVVVLFVITSLRRGGARRLPILLAIVVAIAMAIPLVISASGSGDFLQQRTGLQRYDQERFAGQEVGVELAEEYPLGIGPGQFERRAQVAAHSLFVRVFAEQGIIGLCALIALISTTLVLAGRNAIMGRHTYGISSAALLGAWCGLLLNSAFVDTLHWRHLWIVAALIWAGAMRGSVESEDELPEPASSSTSRARTLPRTPRAFG